MRASRLTARAVDAGGRTAHVYEFDGRPVTVCDSARNVLLVIELFADGEIEPRRKADLLFTMLFPDPQGTADEWGDRWPEMLDSVLWDACGLDVTGKRERRERIFDWEQDAARIKASLRSSYGIDWERDAGSLAFSEVCDLLGMLLEDGRDTPFKTAVSYRTCKEPDMSRWTAEQREDFRKKREHYALRDERTDEEVARDSDRAMTEYARALKKRIRR